MNEAAIAAATGMYSQFSGVLAGLAFAGLVIYLSREGGKDARQGIEVWHVAAATFFSLFSLAVAAFLFANLDGMASTGERNPPYSPGALGTDLLAYGIILALSVLALLYSIVLMVFQYDNTERMTRHAYWAVTAVGTILVLRFLAESALGVLRVNCGHGACQHPEEAGILSLPGIWLTLALAASLIVLLTVAALPDSDGQPAGVVGLLARQVLAPALLVFAAAAFVVIVLSPYTNTRPPGYEPSAAFIDAEYFVSILLVAFFALMFGSVVAPKAGITVAWLLAAQRWPYDKLGRPAALQRLKPLLVGRRNAGRPERALLMRVLLVTALGLAIAILAISGPVALWLLLPVAALTAAFLWSVGRARPAPQPAAP